MGRQTPENLGSVRILQNKPLSDPENTLIFPFRTGDTPLDPARTRCIATRGPGAAEVQERLVEIMESLNIPVLAVYEGGPEERQMIARAKPPTWSSS